VALNHRKNLLDIERLTDEADCSARLEGDLNGIVESCGDQNDRCMTAREMVGQAERRPGKSWHREIKQDEIYVAVQRAFERVLSVDGFKDTVAFTFEQHGQEGAALGLSYPMLLLARGSSGIPDDTLRGSA
jgi:hypothetical protein